MLGTRVRGTRIWGEGQGEHGGNSCLGRSAHQTRSAHEPRGGPRQSSLRGSWALNPSAAGFPTRTSAENQGQSSFTRAPGRCTPPWCGHHMPPLPQPGLADCASPVAGRQGWVLDGPLLRPQRLVRGVGLMVLPTVQPGNLLINTWLRPRLRTLREAEGPPGETTHGTAIRNEPCGRARGPGLDSAYPAVPAAPAESVRVAGKPRAPGTRGHQLGFSYHHTLWRPVGLRKILTQNRSRTS